MDAPFRVSLTTHDIRLEIIVIPSNHFGVAFNNGTKYLNSLRLREKGLPEVMRLSSISPATNLCVNSPNGVFSTTASPFFSILSDAPPSPMFSEPSPPKNNDWLKVHTNSRKSVHDYSSHLVLRHSCSFRIPGLHLPT